MKTDKITVDDLFDKPRRYLIPLFQRGYVWTREGQWGPLWSDLLYQISLLRDQQNDSSRSPRKHFLGAVVLNQTTLGVRHTPTSDVIDGQQRLTTLQVMLVAFRDASAQLKNEFLTAKLGRLTENPGPWPVEDERFKIWPTSSFREDFRRLALAGSRTEVIKAFPQSVEKKKALPRPQLVEAYLFFFDAIERLILTGSLTMEEPQGGAEANSEVEPVPPGLEAAEFLLRAITASLQLVEISLDNEDDAQIIFETLNARGAPLQASDLIRNFVFLYATRRNEDVLKLYEDYWRDFDDEPDASPRSKTKRFWKEEERQGRLKSPRLDLFFYHYITLRTRRDLKITHVFQAFREWWEKAKEPRVAAHELQSVKAATATFTRLIRPTARGRFGEFAGNLKLLDNTTVYPLVLFLGEKQASLTPHVFDGIITDLESYLVRRAICGMTAKNYNRIFLQLLSSLEEQEVTRNRFQQLLLALGGDSSVWPNDDTFKRNFISAPLYTLVGPARTRMVLQTLEKRLHGAKQESFILSDVLTVEHVWPQNPEEGTWPSIGRIDGAPDFDAQEKNERQRHSIGNLTLVTSEFNSSLSNSAYRYKQPAIVLESLLKMNSYFQSFPAGGGWTEANIVGRAEHLFEYAKSAWPFPSAEGDGLHT